MTHGRECDWIGFGEGEMRPSNCEQPDREKEHAGHKMRAPIHQAHEIVAGGGSGSGDATDQIFLFCFTFRADGKGIQEGAQR